MEPEKITIKEKKRADKIEVFDGELLHPSLDIKGTVLVLGFRYRSKPNEEKDMLVYIIFQTSPWPARTHKPFAANHQAQTRGAFYFFPRSIQQATLYKSWLEPIRPSDSTPLLVVSRGLWNLIRSCALTPFPTQDEKNPDVELKLLPGYLYQMPARPAS